MFELAVCTEFAMKSRLVNESNCESQISRPPPVSAIELRQPHLVPADANIYKISETNFLQTWRRKRNEKKCAM